MKNTIKQILGFLLSALAGFLGYQESVEMFVSFGAVLLATYAITNLIKNLLPAAPQVVAWAIGIILSVLGWFLELGIFVDMTWYFAIATGFLISLAANGIYNSEWLETAWNLLKQIFGKKPPVTE